jgi:hypothetical protein
MCLHQYSFYPYSVSDGTRDRTQNIISTLVA